MKAAGEGPVTIELEHKLAAGGEASIWSIVNRPEVVAKIYTVPPTQARVDKLRAMIGAPPGNPSAPNGHTSLCWPLSLLYDDQRRCLGFLMHRLDTAANKCLFNFYNPLTRGSIAPGATWEFLVRIAANTASLVHAVHSAGYVIGDLNESNFMVSQQALVSMVDCDSMQVPMAGGAGVFRCSVGKAEYLAPELHGCDFAKIDRTPEQDRFSLGVLLFQLLMEGVHPYAGIWRGAGDPTLQEKIKRGESAYVKSSHATPSPWSLPLAVLPERVRSLVARCFDEGHRDPRRRPTAHEWHQALALLAQELNTCRYNPAHRYSAHLPDCIWCQMVTVAGVEDHFPAGPWISPLATPRRPRAPTAAMQPPRRRVSGWKTFFKIVGLGCLLGMSLILYLVAAGIDRLGFHVVAALNSLFLWGLVIVSCVKIIGRIRR